MSDRYASERAVPSVPACEQARMSLRFDGHALRGLGSRSVIAYPAVSGQAVNGTFDYSAARQRLPNRGPLPEGEYWVRPSELQENAWYRLRNSRRSWGAAWIAIHPYPWTKTYGRGGFFIHGGGAAGSAGCIDLSVHMDRFVEDLLAELEGKHDCHLPLSVRYLR